MQRPAQVRRGLARIGVLFWLFGYLALAFCWTAPSAQAQSCQAGITCNSGTSKGVKLRAEAGLGGYARAGSWLPVYLTVENSGPDLKGQLVINVAPGAATASNPNYSAPTPLEMYTSLYVQPLEIASQGRKQVTMYVPLATTGLLNQRLTVELRGQLRDGPSTLLASAAVTPNGLTNQLLIGVLSNDPSRFQLYDRLAVSSVNSRTPLHLALAGLDSAHLPDNAQALGSLNALLVSNFDLETLSPDQRTALTDWVDNGGRLIISGGAGSAALLKGLPASLRPVELPAPQAGGPLSAQDQAILERLGGSALPPNSAGSSFVARLKPVAGATVSLAGNNSPLVVSMPHGNGSVVMTAFDLAEPRFTDWNGSSRLWETLLGSAQLSGTPGGSFYNSYGLNSNVLAGGVSSVLTNIPGISLPSLKLLALLAFLYIAIVGPLNYFVLKRLGRRELSWITLPVLTLLFTGGIYLIALRDKGSDVITSSVNIVRLSSQEGQAGSIEKSALAMVGVFTPNNNHYSLGLPANSLVSAVPNYLPSYLPPGASGQTASSNNYQPPVGVQIVQGPRPQVDLLGMNQWSFRSVVVEGTVRLDGGISTDLAQRDGHIQGTITNKTGRKLSDLLVVANFGEYRLAKGLNPGETANVDFANIFGQTKGSASYKGNANIAPFIGYYQGQGSSSPEQRSETRKRDLLNLTFGSLPTSNQSAYAGASVSTSTSPVAVIGWLDEPLLSYTVNDRQIGGNDLTMLIAEAELNPARSNELWPGQVRGQVIDKQETPITTTTTPGQPTQARPPLPAGGASLEIGQLTVEYNLPQLAGRSPRQLTLESPGFVYRRNPYGPPVAPRYTVEVYNFRLASWVAVPGWLAPSPCLLDLPAYQGGAITAPLTSFLPSLARPNLSDSCQAAMKGSITSLPVPATVRPITTSATRAGSTAPTASTSNSALVPVYASGPPDNFVVLENGPGFKLTDFVSPSGQLRARFSRDARSTDVMYWYYFTAGYSLN